MGAEGVTRIDATAEVQEVEAPTAKGIAMTLIGCAALTGIAYLCDRVYRRWLDENHPLAEHRARMRRLSTGYQQQRANLKEAVGIVADVLVEVARATATADGR